MEEKIKNHLQVKIIFLSSTIQEPRHDLNCTLNPSKRYVNEEIFKSSSVSVAKISCYTYINGWHCPITHRFSLTHLYTRKISHPSFQTLSILEKLSSLKVTFKSFHIKLFLCEPPFSLTQTHYHAYESVFYVSKT